MPLVLAVLVWLVLGSRFWGTVLFVFYPVYFVPYGFFISMPLMVKLFRKPASPHRR